MELNMELIRLVHVSCAGISILGFFARGILMMLESPLLKALWIKVVPHVVDTTLLASAIVLAVQLGLSPSDNPWLLAKMVALLLYIGIGVVALRLGRTKQVRIIAWLAALLVFAYIFAVAVTKSPLIIS